MSRRSLALTVRHHATATPRDTSIVTQALVLVFAVLLLVMHPAAASPQSACPTPTQSSQKPVHLPSAVVGRHYSRLLALGGEPPYAVTYEAGSPEEAGLSVDTSGRLVGVPTRPGLFTFTVRIEGATGGAVACQTYQLRVRASRSRSN